MSAWGFPRNLGGPVPSADRDAVGEAATRNNPGLVVRGIEGWEVGVLHSSGEAGEFTRRTLRSEGGTGTRNRCGERRWEYRVPIASQRNNSG